AAGGTANPTASAWSSPTGPGSTRGAPTPTCPSSTPTSSTVTSATTKGETGREPCPTVLRSPTSPEGLGKRRFKMPKKPNQKVTVTLTTDQTIVALLAIEFQRDEVVSLKD